ncbi:copper resistance CopC family protein [Microbacterium karelineae]|uniref:copper resistance CopC family protein n=1 Tax=Microbacterium karelineae TaxID=2654283 RepID=UPI0018D460BB|nr:copper resistance protein CopC [Microbacterium karelineae]
MTLRDSRPPRSRATRTLAGAALAAALLAPLSAAAPAAAHSNLISTTPEGDSPDQQSVIEVLPPEVSLTFSEDLTAPLPADQQKDGESNTQIQVYDSSCEDAGLLIADPGRADTRDCTDYATGDAVVDGPTVTQALDVAGAPAGTYTVVWQVVYGDGHADSQMFTFTTEDAAEDPAEATEEPTDPDPTQAPEETPSAAPSEAPDEPAETGSPDATAPSDDAGIGAPVVIAIVGGVVVLALIAFIVVMIVRARRP